ncbi:hypothetical protein BBJ29_002709 [Phytophthora kernoviae]|uniref:Uncharacterized protein n=1 Tax=Phytophthora kernoviae TaxID=325452 RepID=A0A421FZN0_9STRA|nr:hypothetical protein BBJ29_002709 [Phytophthora kernoviae]
MKHRKLLVVMAQFNALDLQSPFQTIEASLEDRFSALNPNAESDADYNVDGFEYSSDESGCVGFPLERMSLPSSDAHLVPQSLLDGSPQDIEMDDDAMPELMLPAQSIPTRPRSESGDMNVSRVLHPTPEIPQHLHEQHHVELNALRCLGLKVMLSNLSSSSTNANTTSKPSYVYPGVNDRSKTSLLPIRQPSLQAS